MISKISMRLTLDIDPSQGLVMSGPGQLQHTMWPFSQPDIIQSRGRLRSITGIRGILLKILHANHAGS